MNRVNNIQDSDEPLLMQNKERLSKTVKQTRGVKLQSLEMMGGGAPNQNNEFNMNASFYKNPRVEEQDAPDQGDPVMPLEQLQILQNHS